MKFPMFAKYTLLAVLAVSLQGCGINYMIDEKGYGSKEEAISALKLLLSESLAGVTKNSPYVGGKALVLIPPRNIIETYGFKKMGIEPSGETEFILDYLETGAHAIADSVKKGEFFDSVVVARDLSGIQSEKPDHIVSWEIIGLNPWQWFVYRTDNANNKIPISSDHTKKDAESLNSFNNSLSRALISLGSSAVK